jgi:hypothetical protein
MSHTRKVFRKDPKLNVLYHEETGFIMDYNNHRISGKIVDGTICDLTDEDIEECKKRGFEYVKPSPIHKANEVLRGMAEKGEVMTEDKYKQVADLLMEEKKQEEKGKNLYRIEYISVKPVIKEACSEAVSIYGKLVVTNSIVELEKVFYDHISSKLREKSYYVHQDCCSDNFGTDTKNLMHYSFGNCECDDEHHVFFQGGDSVITKLTPI